MKAHNIKGCSYLNKPDIIALLVEKGILDEEVVQRVNRDQEEKEENTKLKAEGVVDEKHERLRSIRNNPRRIEILDRETGEVVLYPSMYKAAQAYRFSAGIMSLYKGQVWKKRYEIKAIDDVAEPAIVDES